MTRLDDRIRDGLREAGGAAAPDVSALTDEVRRRRTQRGRVRRTQAAGLAAIVLAGTVAGYAVLSNSFGGADSVPGTGTAFGAEGIVTTCTGGNAPGTHLCQISADAIQRGATERDIQYLAVIPDEIVANPDVSPDGGRVVFDRSDPDGDGVELFVMTLGESGYEGIALDIFDASWSPEGSMLVAVADGGVGGPDPEQLVVMGADGDIGGNVGLGGGLSFVSNPTWSPDGRRIAFSAVEDGTSDIFTIGDDLMGLRNITETSAFDERNPVWSPDGESIAYETTTPDASAIEYIGLENRTRRRVAEGIVSDPVWSPDGRYIAYVSVEEDQQSSIRAVGLEGGESLLVASHVGEFDWIAAPPPSPSPSAEPTREPSETPAGRDIGLGFNVCPVRGVDPVEGFDLLGDGTPTKVWLVHEVKETGNCGDAYFVAADLSGDGAADAWTQTVPNCKWTGCAILDATDLDADGDEELIIHTYFSIIDHIYFSARKIDAETFEIAPILVAAPGHPLVGIDPGQPLVTSASGDAGYSYWVRCESFPSAPVLVLASAAQPDTTFPLDPAVWHETRIQLQEDGYFHVIGTNDFSLPAGDDPGLILSDAPACGVDFNIWADP